MRTPILIPTAVLLVALGSGCDTPNAAAAEHSINAWASRVAGNCPAGEALIRAAGADAAADHNHDGYACVRRGISIGGDSLIFEVDNDASIARGAVPGDPVWNWLYRGM